MKTEKLGRSMHDVKPKSLKDLQIGDHSCYPVDYFDYTWIGHQTTDWRDKSYIETPFIPEDMINDWAKRLTGRPLGNKDYVVVHVADDNVLALFRADDSVGLIRLLKVRRLSID